MKTLFLGLLSLALFMACENSKPNARIAELSEEVTRLKAELDSAKLVMNTVDEDAVYLVAKYTITDAEGFAPYKEKVGGILTTYGVEFVSLDSSPRSLEGDSADAGVILKFEDMETLERFLESSAYQAILPDRLNHTSNTYIGVFDQFTQASE